MKDAFKEFEELEKKITQGTVPSYILLEGEEDFLVHDATHRLLRSLLPDLIDGINYEKWDGEQDRLDGFLADMMTFPMLAERKIYHMTAGETFMKKKGTSSLRTRIEKFLERDVPAANILLVSSNGAADKTLKIVKFFKKRGVIVSWDELKTYNPGDPRKDVVFPVIQRWLAESGSQITADAFFELRKRVPQNLWALHTEIEKLVQYVGSAKKISLDDIIALTPRGGTDQMFDLTDAVSARNYQLAFSVFRELSAHESSLLGLHTLLSNHLLSLFQTRQWIARAFSGRLPGGFSYSMLQQTCLPQWRKELEAAQDKSWLGLFQKHPFVLFKTFQSAVKFGDEQLLDAICSLQQLENDVKSRIINHQASLEMIIRRLCRAS